jgi:hypothetical protein
MLRDYSNANTTPGGGALIAVYKSYYGVKRNAGLWLIKECVWIGIPVSDNSNFVLGNHCVAPEYNAQITENYFKFFEPNLSTCSWAGMNSSARYPVACVNYYSWIVRIYSEISICPTMVDLMGTSLPTLYYYSYNKKGNANHATVCFLGLNTTTLTVHHYTGLKVKLSLCLTN